MELALIPPVSLLGYTELTNYQLALPHMLNDERYLAWYLWLAEQEGQYVILDNGEAEGENKHSAVLLLDMAVNNFDEVVAHDVIGDFEATIKRTTMFLDTKLATDADVKVGVVVQGDNMDECNRVIDYFAEHNRLADAFQVFYLPRHVLKFDREARLKLAEKIHDVFDDKYEIHCLGTNPIWMQEVEELGQQKIVRGVDTSAPFNYAFATTYIDMGAPVSRPDNYFDLPVDAFTSAVLDANIRRLKAWVNGRS
jgi:hypothetical protein